MNILEQLYSPGFLAMLAPFVFVLLFTIFFRTMEASHFFVNISRVLYSLVLAGVMFYSVGQPDLPPQDFFNAVTLAFASLILLFICGKKLRYLYQLLVFNFLIFFLLKGEFKANPVFIMALTGILNILFSLFFSLAIGKKNIIIKILHAGSIVALAYWAITLNQNLIALVAILCASSLIMVVILRILFLGGIIPNFSRPIVDVGIPIILLWMLIKISGVFFDYLSPYISVGSFIN